MLFKQTCRHISHFILYNIPQLAWPDIFLLFFFSFEYFDPYDHYAACWATLNVTKMFDVHVCRSTLAYYFKDYVLHQGT